MFRRAVVFALCLSFGMAASAATDPAKKVVLKVTGDITNTNSKDKKSYDFTLADLQKLEQVTIKATTEWTEADAPFKGPLMKEILRVAGAKPSSKEVILRGLDGYRARAPISDFDKYNVVAALSVSGQLIPAAKKGPVWLMYPLNDFPAELKNNETATKLVWQLTTVTVK